MRIYSIRWKLPLSYAAIALLAASILGAVMLTVLREFYVGQERAYIENNANGFSALTQHYLSSSLDITSLTPRVKTLSFISDTRIQLLDTAGSVLIDSNLPSQLYVEFVPSAGWDVSEPHPGSPSPGDLSYLRLSDVLHSERLFSVGKLLPIKADFLFFKPFEIPIRITGIELGQNITWDEAPPRERDFVLSASHTPFGFRISESPLPPESTRRSDQEVTLPLYNTTQELTGYVRLLQGPAYGSEVVDRVAQTWILASAVAVILAAAAGWLTSRQLTFPLISLTETTRRMASGDLSARACLQRRDELGELAAVFNDMAARIEATVITLRRFVADAAHELHTPLTALRTNLELLGEGEKIDCDVHRRALQQLTRMQYLTDDLLDLSGIEARSQQAAVHQRIDLTPIIHNLCELYASRAEQCDINFDLDVPTGELLVIGDGSQISRMIANLLDNALKFTPPGGSVDLHIQRMDRCIHIAVHDTGIGIPTGDIPYLFDRFWRGRDTASYPGSGLGLAIVKAIADAHNGQINVTSEAANTTIAVRLALAGRLEP